MFLSEEPSVHGLKHIIKIKFLTLYILAVCLQVHNIALRGRDKAQDSSLTPPLFVDIPVPSQESKR